MPLAGVVRRRPQPGDGRGPARATVGRCGTRRRTWSRSSGTGRTAPVASPGTRTARPGWSGPPRASGAPTSMTRRLAGPPRRLPGAPQLAGVRRHLDQDLHPHDHDGGGLRVGPARGERHPGPLHLGRDGRGRRERTTLDWRIPFGFLDQGFSSPCGCLHRPGTTASCSTWRTVSHWRPARCATSTRSIAGPRSPTPWTPAPGRSAFPGHRPADRRRPADDDTAERLHRPAAHLPAGLAAVPGTGHRNAMPTLACPTFHGHTSARRDAHRPHRSHPGDTAPDRAAVMPIPAAAASPATAPMSAASPVPPVGRPGARSPGPAPDPAAPSSTGPAMGRRSPVRGRAHGRPVQHRSPETARVGVRLERDAGGTPPPAPAAARPLYSSLPRHRRPTPGIVDPTPAAGEPTADGTTSPTTSSSSEATRGSDPVHGLLLKQRAGGPTGRRVERVRSALGSAARRGRPEAGHDSARRRPGPRDVAGVEQAKASSKRAARPLRRPERLRVVVVHLVDRHRWRRFTTASAPSAGLQTGRDRRAGRASSVINGCDP